MVCHVHMPDGTEKRRKREKIIDRDLAASYRIGTDYDGPLTKSDAQRVLDLLIAQDAGTFTPPNAAATFAEVAREYLTLAKPNWGPHMVRAAGNLVEKHIVAGKLGGRAIADLAEPDLQGWLNEYISNGASRSLLKGLLHHTRAIFKAARKRKIITENPTEDLRVRSKTRPCERYLSLDECRQLVSQLTGRDHLIVRTLIQVGLRPEELFALRRDDVQGDVLRVDEALVEGKPAPVKTEASEGCVYIPAELSSELAAWMEENPGEPRDWLFQTTHGRPGHLNQNNYRQRVLQPAAIRAGIGLIDTGKKDEKGRSVFKTDVDFRALRRTCATHFGDKAKDPKSVQAQLRHADPTITLKHYQKSIPESVRAAGDELERELGFGLPAPAPTVK